MRDESTAIPLDLLVRLNGLRPVLCRRGSVFCRKDADRAVSWRLRYREPVGSRAFCSRTGDGELVGAKWCHRSIPLGGEAVALAVIELLAGWKSQERQRREAVREAERAEDGRRREWARLLREKRRLYQQQGGGGRRRRARLGREFDRAAGGSGIGAFALLMAGAYAIPNRRPGRPRKAGLVLMPLVRGEQGG